VSKVAELILIAFAGWSFTVALCSTMVRLAQMPGGHELIFSNPTGLADKIFEAGRAAS
jgi:hypothetical protein